MPSDNAIWDRFLIAYPDYFNAVSYDVRVGEGIQPAGEIDPAISEMAVLLTQRRIDVLGERQNKLFIIEVKQDPGVSILGQLLGYETLLRLQDPRIKDTEPIAIVNRIFPDLEKILAAHNIKFFVV